MTDESNMFARSACISHRNGLYGDSCSQTVKLPTKSKKFNFEALRGLQRKAGENNVLR